MTNKEKLQHIRFIQYRFNYIMRMIPRHNDITLLESSTHIDNEGCKIIDYVLFRIGNVYYRMRESLAVEVIAEDGSHICSITKEGTNVWRGVVV
jgi:hypothetical protein